MLRSRVCDSCHSRKVRCDCNDPCGNCLDKKSTCTRARNMKRLPKRNLAQMQRRSRQHQADEALAVQPLATSCRSLESLAEQSSDPFISTVLPHQMEDGFLMDIPEDGSSMLLEHLDMNYGPPSWMSFVPLTDDQMATRHQVGHSQGLAWNRRQALQSALSVASQLLGGMEKCTEMAGETANSEEQRNIPSLEFLYWMLNDLCSDKFGSFVLDFFRHIDKHTLKHMGLSIIFNTATSCDSILYTICVNSVAYKFLNTISGTERDDNLARMLRHRALLYRETAITALKKIALMTRPSLSLLQALLCGVFLQQGAGDTNVCWELTRTACRVCMDIGLHPAGCSEEEYYCFMWCYILDRNYAWKLGKPRILTIEPNTNMGPPASNTAASELILIYLNLAKVQDTMIPFLKDSSKADKDAFQSFHGVGTHVLQKMESIRRNIDQIKLPSTNWTGLDFHHEIATLDFAYHSIMTCILHLHLATPDQEAADNYLGSARRELLALIAICASTDTQKTVAYLHWTLLYYPLTAYFAIFCNAVATCHTGDFQILKALANCLAESGTISQPIATMHSLFQQFVSLSWCFFSEENTTISSADECVVRPRSSSHHWGAIAGTGSSPLSLPSWMESALSQEVLATATVRQAFEPSTTFSVLENVFCFGSSPTAESISILLTGRRVACGLILANSLLGISRLQDELDSSNPHWSSRQSPESSNT